MKEWMRQTAPDYKMNLIDARHLSGEEIDRFEGDLRAFLLMLQERFSRKKLKTAVAIHRETWYAFSRIKNDERYEEYIDGVSDEELERGIYMDAALEELATAGEKIGEARGETRGKAEGEAKLNRLGLMLTEAGRVDDFLKSLSDKELQRKLFVEFGLKEV